MAKDPAFLFYSSDFLTGTMIMPFEDRGKYITILSYMHQNGRLGEETIRLLVGNVSDMLRLKFEVDKKGLWFNVRLEEETEKRRNFVESRLENGKKGGRPRKNQETDTKPLGKPTHNLHEDVNKDDNVIDFKEGVQGKPLEPWEQPYDPTHADLCEKVLTDFGFSKQNNYRELSRISEALTFLKSSNEFNYFADQYPAYWIYKSKVTTEQKQSLETFFDWMNRYENPGWRRKVWTHEVEQLTKAKPLSKMEEGIRKAQQAKILRQQQQK